MNKVFVVYVQFKNFLSSARELSFNLKQRFAEINVAVVVDTFLLLAFVVVVRVIAGSEEGAAWRIDAASSALELLLVLASVADSVLSRGLSTTERCWDWSSSMEGSVLIILWCGTGRGARKRRRADLASR